MMRPTTSVLMTVPMPNFCPSGIQSSRMSGAEHDDDGAEAEPGQVREALVEHVVGADPELGLDHHPGAAPEGEQADEQSRQAALQLRDAREPEDREVGVARRVGGRGGSASVECTEVGRDGRRNQDPGATNTISRIGSRSGGENATAPSRRQPRRSYIAIASGSPVQTSRIGMRPLARACATAVSSSRLAIPCRRGPARRAAGRRRPALLRCSRGSRSRRHHRGCRVSVQRDVTEDLGIRDRDPDGQRVVGDEETREVPVGEVRRVAVALMDRAGDGDARVQVVRRARADVHRSSAARTACSIGPASKSPLVSTSTTGHGPAIGSARSPDQRSSPRRSRSWWPG